MVKQYPYILKLFQEAEATFNQATAEWEGGEAKWVTISYCRDEINGGGSKITKTDGEAYVYSAVVYAPKHCPSINTGAKIQVWNGNVLRLEATVQRFAKEQLHTRIWV
ncbi:hypothetical protein [Riemerella anatipestifer]|uniref:Head-tail adaptor protein n=1 Tax=Riemerella anatipestifer (strain ATCC 11845 / DSM 15868 / JCM 9532 / NCTC 11014) TaxID=693978 RepID=E4TE79_RIEAD|nr:hypothetical protein [Riemerella anatipestifer]ADQ83088.1 hypothetical protein Riean_1935 [Riemerella anatipestifer ATCC 11845 = DSM 15868]AFD55150.1 hypothetical protein RA0C_0135 [Riemerella anatipestifer ATCC 11845 = DSM 15868]MRM84774.1 hypothetical protein [Riemerella anatipestifer]MRM93208.1 hypothetical protein [Riemerella anatipestifer]MRN05455.1 hypothetical protein [Riemerella anatipestifer]